MPKNRQPYNYSCLTAFGWSSPLQRYSIFLSHHSSHQLQLQLQPAQQYFSLTPFQLQPAERSEYSSKLDMLRIEVPFLYGNSSWLRIPIYTATNRR